MAVLWHGVCESCGRTSQLHRLSQPRGTMTRYGENAYYYCERCCQKKGIEFRGEPQKPENGELE